MSDKPCLGFLGAEHPGAEWVSGSIPVSATTEPGHMHEMLMQQCNSFKTKLWGQMTPTRIHKKEGQIVWEKSWYITHWASNQIISSSIRKA